MTDSLQRQEWADHLGQEREALRAQQRSAGDTHEPVQGPLPHTADDLKAAILAERERCAAIAAAWAAESRLRETFSDFTEWELKASAEVARAIANAIRG
jgi:hypothetical protein